MHGRLRLVPALVGWLLVLRMSIQAKRILTVSGLLAVVVLGADLLLGMIPARPSSAVRTAQSFVDGLRDSKLQQAYQLTTRRGEVGGSLAEFQAVVRQQWPATAPAFVRFKEARPFQSYGNRLRRWLHGREADPPQLWLEFSVGGVPFTVREIHGLDGEWKVDYFESHAG